MLSNKTRIQVTILCILFVVLNIFDARWITFALGTPQIVSISPSSPSPVGACIKVHAKVNWDSEFRSMRMRFGNEGWQEEATPDLEREFCTGNYSAGWYKIRVEVARHGDDTWSNATFTEADYQLTSGGQSSSSSTSCSVQSIDVSPRSANLGQEFTISGSGTCNNGVRAIRFKVDGGIIYEIGAPSAKAKWNSSGASIGIHIATVEVAGQGDNNWTSAASASIELMVTGNGNSQSSTSGNEEDGIAPDGTSFDRHVPFAPGIPALADARLTDDRGKGVHTSIYCQAMGQGGVTSAAEDTDNAAYSWKCEKGLSLGNFNTVCYNVWGNNYHAISVLGANKLGTWRCVERQSNNSNSDSSNQSNTTCSPSANRLHAGDIGVVSDYDPYPLKVYTRADLDSGIKFTVRVKEMVSIISGPVCTGGNTWVEVGYNGNGGWAVEANKRGFYNLIPNGQPLPGNASSGHTSNDSSSNNSNSNNSSGNCPATRLSIGGQGRITYGGGSTGLRNRPRGTIILDLPEGYEFTVVSGPECLEGDLGYINWWEIQLKDGTSGWAPEGKWGEYWLEPVNGSSNVGSEAPISQPENISNKIVYFALGDSVASGHGLPDADDTPCRQSAQNAYPVVVANLLRKRYQNVDFNFYACSGATVLSSNQSHKSFTKQVDDVLQTLTNIPINQKVLISISIGMNDFGWTDFKNLPHVYEQGDGFYNWVNSTRERIADGLREQVKRLLNDPHQIAIVLVMYYNPLSKDSFLINAANLIGYPYLTCDILTADTCYGRINTLIGLYNAALTLNVWVELGQPQQVRLTGQLATKFEGHVSPCGFDSITAVNDTWIQYPRDGSSKAFPKGSDCFHPNIAGAEAIAVEVNTEASKLGR